MGGEGVWREQWAGSHQTDRDDRGRAGEVRRRGGVMWAARLGTCKHRWGHYPRAGAQLRSRMPAVQHSGGKWPVPRLPS